LREQRVLPSSPFGRKIILISGYIYRDVLRKSLGKYYAGEEKLMKKMSKTYQEINKIFNFNQLIT
jgi:hypothetical protein